MSTEANKVLVRRYREAYNTNNLALLDEVVAADIKSHSGMPGISSGLEGGKIVHRTFLAAFPNGHVTTEDLIAEGDQVVERFSFRGTNTCSLMHAPATGKKVTFSGVSIFRIANCKLVEHWGANNTPGTREQLNWVPTPGPGHEV
jgi:predicted ester cyclase